MADELVNTEKEYRNVAKAMLGRIVVVDNVDNAVKIARKFDYGIRMVTLEGELLVPGGAISGGAFKNNSNLLGRRREMDELEKKVKKLSDDIKTYNQKIEGAKSKRNKLRMDLEALKTEMQRKSIEQNTARLNISQARERMEEEAESAQSLKLEECTGIETSRSSEIRPARKQSYRNWLQVKNWRKPLRNRFLSSRRNWKAADWKRVKLPPMPENGK